MSFTTPPSAAGNVGVSDFSLADALMQRDLMDRSGCTHCTGCAACLQCTDCHYCTRCISGCGLGYCTDCDYCSDCTRCVACKRCTGCVRCTACTDLAYRINTANNLKD